MRRFGVSSLLESSIKSFLENKKTMRDLAESVQRLSDFFINPRSQETPWQVDGAPEAYAAYFLPLGVARAQAVVTEALDRSFFDGLDSYVDFGSGPGTMSHALNKVFSSGTCIESSEQAISLHKKLGHENLHWLKYIGDYKKLQLAPIHIKTVQKKTLLTMSYSLNELKDIPRWIFEFDALLVLEPSTQGDFVKLSQLREQLIEQNWHIWAPCTHQKKCPLSGGRDWCHDRIEFDPPVWWGELETFLPMKNKTITFSYLIARKDRGPQIEPNLARLVGDRLEEKGKTRQMVCRGEDREFLSWLHKEGTPPYFNRGETLVLPAAIEKRGNELRLK